MLLSLLFQNPIAFFITFGLLIVAISVHECAHAFTADRLGDPTPKVAGRLTLNPLAHLDPIGTILLLVAGFGWGKPVPFDPFNLRNPSRDAALISFAGPLSNILMAITASLLIRLLLISQFFASISVILIGILGMFIYFNILLAIFNLVPVHPLDGFKVLAGLLPKKYYEDWMSLSRYGVIFLLFLIFPFFGRSPLTTLINPIINVIVSILIPPNLGGGII